MASLGVPSRQQALGEVQAVLPPAGLAGVAPWWLLQGTDWGWRPPLRALAKRQWILLGLLDSG